MGDILLDALNLLKNCECNHAVASTDSSAMTENLDVNDKSNMKKKKTNKGCIHCLLKVACKARDSQEALDRRGAIVSLESLLLLV